MAHKLQNSVMDNTILTKQLENWKKEHGELLLIKVEIERKLAESQIECQNLRKSSESLMRERDEQASKFTMEIEILKKQLRHYKEENQELAASKLAAHEELSQLVGEIDRAEEEKKREISRREKEAEEKVEKVMEDLERREKQRKDEVGVLMEKNNKLQREFDGVVDAGIKRFRDLEQLVFKLEQDMAIWKASLGSGAQQFSKTGANEQRSFGFAAETKGHTGSQSIEEETLSPVPSFDKSESKQTPISQVIDIDLDDDDDDYNIDDFPSPKKLKWELSSSESPNERQNGGKNSGENW